tara:strand:+ start:2665 stop:3867 length:1203 start_codon:yes stop_codon:yes gene_type:complete
MLFSYKATTADGQEQEGTIEASNQDSAISALQKRGYFVLSIDASEKKEWYQVSFFERVKTKDIVIMSRQLATLFEAKVPVLDSFRLLSDQAENPLLGKTLKKVADDIQAGQPLSRAMQNHADVFSDFYVNMVASGEESGKFSETFNFLADYLERQYELKSKAQHALIYPAFIIIVFFAVMALMFTVVVPRLSEIIQESGQEIPIYTQIVIALSEFFVAYGLLIVVALVLAGLGVWRYSLTEQGKHRLDLIKLRTPLVGDLYSKLYLSRIADNLDTLLTSGVSMLKALEVTQRVVGNQVYKDILGDAMDEVRGGGTISESFARHEEVPAIMVHMLRIGEETGKLGFVLGTISRFYKREVEQAIQTMVSLIEPIMIILLGLGVGVLLTSVLLPIYNLAGSIA